MEPTTLHPPLSPADRTLLTSYLAHDQNLPALAAHLASGCHGSSGSDASRASTPDSGPPSVPSCLSASVPSSPDLFDLLTWLAQPHIRAFLDAHDHAAARADQATARSDRLLAATALRRAIDDADSPLELRRAATSLARASMTRAPSWSRLREQSSPRPTAPSPSNSSHTLTSAIRALTRTPAPHLDDDSWLEAFTNRGRGSANGPPPTAPHRPSNGHDHVAPPDPRTAPGGSAVTTAASPGTHRFKSQVSSPPSPPSPPPCPYTDPILEPLSRLPLTPNSAFLLRAKSGAAPPPPPTPNSLPWLANSG